VVYQWTDAAGLTHFSDRAPPPAARNPHAVETPAVTVRRPEGLRPDERARLQEIEHRSARRQRQVLKNRRHAADAASEHRRDCRERRTRQNATGNHARRRAEATYLRRHCW
jgi:hypothetical protein